MSNQRIVELRSKSTNRHGNPKVSFKGAYGCILRLHDDTLLKSPIHNTNLIGKVCLLNNSVGQLSDDTVTDILYDYENVAPVIREAVFFATIAPFHPNCLQLNATKPDQILSVLRKGKGHYNHSLAFILPDRGVAVNNIPKGIIKTDNCIKKLLNQGLSTLAFLEQLRMAHDDVTSGNVTINLTDNDSGKANFEPTIIDWGNIIFRLDDHRRETHCRPDFGAPETHTHPSYEYPDGKAIPGGVSKTSDLYSLGVVMSKFIRRHGDYGLGDAFSDIFTHPDPKCRPSASAFLECLNPELIADVNRASKRCVDSLDITIPGVADTVNTWNREKTLLFLFDICTNLALDFPLAVHVLDLSVCSASEHDLQKMPFATFPFDNQTHTDAVTDITERLAQFETSIPYKASFTYNIVHALICLYISDSVLNNEFMFGDLLYSIAKLFPTTPIPARDVETSVFHVLTRIKFRAFVPTYHQIAKHDYNYIFQPNECLRLSIDTAWSSQSHSSRAKAIWSCPGDLSSYVKNHALCEGPLQSQQ
jgi:serine/threonine protein kinase